jgi:uncharacterized RDD family membrane protein YckC
LFRRFCCWIYEGVLIFGVLSIAGYLFATLTQTKHALHNRLGLQIFLFLILGAYFVWFWQRGQTLAMKTWKIKVVDREQQALSAARATARYVLSWLWFLPPLLLAYVTSMPPSSAILCMSLWPLLYMALSTLLPQKQFLHDVLAGTQIVFKAKNV